LIALGYGFNSAPKSLIANRLKTQTLVNDEGKVLDANFEKTSDDTIFFHGYLTSGVPFSFTLRGGAPFKGTPGLDWRIYGEKGEIRVTAGGPFIQAGLPDVKVQLHDFESDTVNDVKIEEDEFDEEGKYSMYARNVGRLYKGLAEGKVICSFEDAVERHELFDTMYKENGIVP